MIAWLCSFPIPLLWNTVFAWSGEGAPNFLHYLAAYGYIVSFVYGVVVYVALMRRREGKEGFGFVTQAEHDAMTVK